MKHTHPSNQTHSAFRKISYLLLMLVALSTSDVQADDSTNNDFPLSTSFKIEVGNSDWRVDGEAISEFDVNIYNHLISTKMFGGVFWEAQNFGVKSTNWVSLRCGAMYDNTVATIRNYSPIPTPISQIVINLASIDSNYTTYLREIRVKISDSPDMVEAESYTYTGEIRTQSPLDPILISNPKANMYYSVEFDCAKSVHLNAQGVVESADGWLVLNSITFYRPLSDVPLATYSKDENGKTLSAQFISDKGDLHLIADEYDYDGNFTRHLIGSSTSSNSPTRAPQQYPDNWTNKVADQNTAYTVEKPDADDRMVLIRAKSVTGDSHSPETQTILTSEGIVTGINQVFDNQSLSTLNDYDEYFDLHGRKINRPASPGIYLHRTPAGTQKVIIH